MNTNRRLIRERHKEARIMETLEMTKYKATLKKNGRTHPETREAMERHLRASARAQAERAKRLMTLEAQAKGARKAKIREERIAAEAAYNITQKFRGLE